MEIYTDRVSVTFRDDSEYLSHYGRLGMKWGKHIFGRDRSSGSRAMSDDELRAAIARGKKVQEYRRLESELATVPKGRRTATKAMSMIGKVGGPLAGMAKQAAVLMKKQANSHREKGEEDKAKALEEQAKLMGNRGKSVENAGKALSSMSNTLSEHNTKVAQNKHDDISHMTDAELQAAISRKQLESDYRRYCLTDERGSAGRTNVESTLEFAGTLMATATSAAQLASAISDLRSGRAPSSDGGKKKK